MNGSREYSEDDFKADQWNHLQPEIFSSLKKNSSHWDRLENEDCIRTYAQNFVTERNDVVVVTSSDTDEPFMYQPSFRAGERSYRWIFPRLWYGGLESGNWRELDIETVIKEAQEGNWKIANSVVKYCLSEKTEAKCTLQFHAHIMMVTIICNIVKFTCMTLVLIKHNEKPLVTIGDAVESFLSSPIQQRLGFACSPNPR
jgi:hypothetical protein